MTSRQVALSGLVRITVTAGPRRADLAVPCAVPLVELLPELARSVGMLDGATAPGGYRVLTTLGEELRPDAGLAAQGIGHGHVLVVSAYVEEPSAVLDDPVEALVMVDVPTTPWDRRTAWRTRVGLAAVLLLVGAVVLALQHGGGWSVGEDAVLAGSALTVAAVLSRARHEPVAAVTAAYVACAYAAVAGLSAAGDPTVSGAAVAGAGGGLTVGGLVAAVALSRGRCWMLPGLVLGLAALAAGLATELTSLEPAVVLSCMLTLAVLGEGTVPDAALAASGVGRHVLSPLAGPDGAVAAGLDPCRLAEEVEHARELVVVLRTTLGGLLVVLTPVAVTLGPLGTALPLLGSAVVLLRVRRCRTAAEVAVGIVTGVVTLLSTALSLAWLEPASRPTVGTGLAALGAAVLFETVGPALDGLRARRWADLAERAALGALVPALLLNVVMFPGRA